MLITDVEVYPVKLPFKYSVSDSLGTYISSNHCILIVHTDAGVYGAGEVALAWFGGSHSFVQEIRELWAPLLIGENARRISYLMKRFDSLLPFSKRHLLVRAAFEMALFDAVGKASGLPVYQLLGGKMRESIPLTGGINLDTPERMVEAAKERVKEGYKELKIKVGTDVERDIEIVKAIRSSIPDEVKLRIDANMCWSDQKAAARYIQRFAEQGVSMVEQPLAPDRLADLAELRARTEAAILLDESVWDAKDALACLQHGAADLLHIYISEAGGLTAAKTISDLASLYHVPCTIGSMPEGRIGTAASLHAAAAMSNLSERASDIRGFTIYKKDVVKEDFEISGGSIAVPDRPGLGITVDFDALRELTVHEGGRAG